MPAWKARDIEKVDQEVERQKEARHLAKEQHQKHARKKQTDDNGATTIPSSSPTKNSVTSYISSSTAKDNAIGVTG